MHNSKHSDCSLLFIYLWKAPAPQKIKKGLLKQCLICLLCLDSCSLRLLSLMNVQKSLSSSLLYPYFSLLTLGKCYLLHEPEKESASTCFSAHIAISNCRRPESSWQRYRLTRNSFREFPPSSLPLASTRVIGCPWAPWTSFSCILPCTAGCLI